jgi:hypothetical protein
MVQVIGKDIHCHKEKQSSQRATEPTSNCFTLHFMYSLTWMFVFAVWTGFGWFETSTSVAGFVTLSFINVHLHL